MGELSKAFPASLDDVLTAVKETPRGRWFLEAYEARLRSGETARVMEAITKLENHVTALAKSGTTPGADSAMLQRAREAIAKARQDIGALEPSTPGLSAEAKLFAQLAEKARTAFNGAPAQGQSISRALQLVSDLDSELNSPAAPAKPDFAPAAQDSQPAHYFKQDEAVFEPAPKKAPALAITPTGEANVESAPRGAKLVINRVAAAIAAAPLPPAPAPQELPPAAAPQDVSATAPEAKSTPVEDIKSPAQIPPAITASPLAEDQPKSRIVIIRRKADEMVNLPLIDQPDLTPATPVSAA